MQLVYMKFENYRNLDNLQVEINRDANFIVGENNVGKSNFQNGLIKVLSGKSFLKEDFADEDEKIIVHLRFHLSDEEIGIFDDLVDPSDSEKINIIAVQESPDEYIKYHHKETGEQIQASLIKRINIIAYDSLRNPKNEIDFSKTKGAGAFLNYIVRHYVSNSGNNKILKTTEVKKVEKYTAEALNKLVPFNRFSIIPHVEEDDTELLSRVLLLKDSNNVSISDNGYGVQFNLLIMLSLLEKIIDFSKKKKDEEEEFSTLLIFDEPEIHLHPYLQRAIMKDILCLANGEDEQFNGLLREYFGIKKITAQIIVTTHSPNILSDDYKKIIRMYKADGLTKALSVKGLELTKAEQKQLLMQFEFIKEAVFARAAIVVEGVSEIGSFPAFASKLDIDFDKEGIALINAGGADSVLPIIKLLNKLGINSVGVIDNDKKVEENLPDEEYLFYTKTKCFDREVVERVSQNKNYDVLEKILMSYDSQGLDRCIHQKKLNSTKVKYGFKGVEITDSYKFKDVEKTSKLSKVMYVTWFEINKGILLGKTIGAEIEKKDIPICYIKAIRKAEKYAKGK